MFFTVGVEIDLYGYFLHGPYIIIITCTLYTVYSIGACIASYMLPYNPQLLLPAYTMLYTVLYTRGSPGASQGLKGTFLACGG